MEGLVFQLVGKDGRKYLIGPDGLTIGSNPENDVVVEDLRASPRHARLLYAGGRYWVRDEKSASGTFINGNLVHGQQEMVLGDILQIGSTEYRLETSSSSISMAARSRRGLFIAGLLSITLLLIVLAIAAIGPPSSIGFITSTSTSTDTLTSLPTINDATLTPQTMIIGATSSPPVATDTPFYSAAISCEDLDDYVDIRNCSVTNLGSDVDNLWLSFQPFRLGRTNDFNLTVIVDESGDVLSPDRKGLIPLGSFSSSEEKSVTLRMICVNIDSGCPLTAIHVQLLAGDGSLAMTGVRGEFDIQNVAFVPTKPPSEELPPAPTGSPTTSPPTATSTPSDAFGPTPTP